MQVPQWAKEIEPGTAGILRSNALKYLCIGSGALMLALGIVMPVATWGGEGVEEGGVLAIGAVFAVIGLAMFWLAFAYVPKPMLRVDDTGITRLQMGYVLIPWADISEIRPGIRGAIDIKTPNGRTKKDGSKTRTKTFQIQTRQLQGGRYLLGYLTECWNHAGGYRSP
ncbi:hypothetical protein [Cumulibacter soli]|uniref:hypothetical protein n=1 Tax=Cumulibacter soli TaxID=2546344 RepID=UPI001068505D|nr:hypothetical protein [Cumulibacter soli]